MSTGTALVVALLLLAGNAFFVGAEFALIAARRTQIEPLAAAGGRGARLTLRAIENVSLMMAGAQLGITMCSLGLGAIAEPAVARLIEPLVHAIGVPDSLLHPVAFVVALAVVVFFHMTVGEMVPKNIAIAVPERSALVLGPALYVVVQVLKPLLFAINWMANSMLRLLKVQPKDEVTSAFTAEQVAGLVAESGREGLLDADELTLLTGALNLSDERVTAVMLPREQVVTLPLGASFGQVEELCLRTGYSRFPVVDDGAYLGYVHVKDLLGHDGDPRAPVPEQRLRPFVRLTQQTPLDTALTAMQTHGTHMALVVADDQVIGAAMLEDVVERLIGEIVDVAQSAGR